MNIVYDTNYNRLHYVLRASGAYVVIAVCMVATSPLTAVAAVYLPGETIDPACFPTDLGCGVTPPWDIPDTGLKLKSRADTPVALDDRLYNLNGVLFWNTVPLSLSPADDLPPLAINSSDILDGSILGIDLAPDSVRSSKILDGSIENHDLESSAIGLALGTAGTDVSVSAPHVSLGATLTLNIPSASALARGLLTSDDWLAFNAKEPAILSSTPAAYYRGDKTWAALDTSAVPENGNLYYTQGRFDAAILGTTTDALTEGLFNRYYSTQLFAADLAGTTTDAIAEGSARRYFTDARTDARINATTTLETLRFLPNLFGATTTHLAVMSIAPGSVLRLGASGSIVAAIDGIDYLTEMTGVASIGPADGALRGSVLLATSTTTHHGLASTLTIATSSGTLTVTPALSGILAAEGGGTGISHPAAAGVLVGTFSGGGWQQLATSSLGLITTNVDEGSNLYYTDARFDGRFSQKTTSDLTEGMRLYWTEVRGNENFAQNLAATSTTALAEGLNLYYTQTRFDTALSAKTTDDLDEGSNLYYTDARVNAFVHASTTLPKTYAGSTFTELQRFNAGLESADIQSATAAIGGTATTTFLANGNVGINVPNPTARLHVSGAVIFAGLTTAAGGNALCINANEVRNSNNTTCLLSSERYKHHIAPLDAGLREVLALRPVSYRYNDDIGIPGEQVGLIAEEVVDIDPRLVAFDSDGRPDAVRYENLGALLVAAVHDISTMVATDLETQLLKAGKIETEELCIKKSDGSTRCVTADELEEVLSAIASRHTEEDSSEKVLLQQESVIDEPPAADPAPPREEAVSSLVRESVTEEESMEERVAGSVNEPVETPVDEPIIIEEQHSNPTL